jgi:predicted PurR-regulated permease PerM
MRLTVRLTRITNVLLIIAIVVAAMVYAKPVLIPIVFGIVLALLLLPICRFFERWQLPRILAIVFSFLVIAIVLGGIITFFSTQVGALFEDIKTFEKKLMQLAESVNIMVVQSDFGKTLNLSGVFEEQSSAFMSESTRLIGQTVTSSIYLLGMVGLTIVYVFLFLLYRSSFRNLIVLLNSDENQEDIRHMISSIRKVAQNYFYGMFTVILMVGTLNGIGLWLIGIDHAFLFGYFAAFLTIVPYIGTTLGGLIPFTYSLIYYDPLWMPLAVAALYIGIQQLEGNILTPKIVGESVSINPLFALLALIVGGMIWGVAGMILFIPMVAMLKVLFDHIPSMRPYGVLLSSEFPENDFGKLIEKTKQLLINKKKEAEKEKGATI